MKYENRKIAGLLLFIAGVQCVLGIIIAETLYPGYSTSENYISDLGVGSSALIFNSSVFLLGVLVVADAYFVQRAFNSKLFSILLIITGIGAMGVGLFTEDAGVIHVIFSLITFIFAGISAMLSYRLLKPPLSYFSIILGALSLLALILFASGNYLGLGKGGMERMIAYPTLLWAIGLGSHVIGYSNKTSETVKP